MQTIIYQIVPNEWVTEKLLIAATGLKPGTILRARKESWLLGREYKQWLLADIRSPPASVCTTFQRLIAGLKTSLIRTSIFDLI